MAGAFNPLPQLSAAYNGIGNISSRPAVALGQPAIPITFPHFLDYSGLQLPRSVAHESLPMIQLSRNGPHFHHFAGQVRVNKWLQQLS